MTIDELNILIGADDTALGRGLASAISKLQNFATAAAASAAQAGQGLDGFANRAGDAGTRAADNLARGFSSLNSKLSVSFAAADAQIKTLEAGFGRLGETLQSVGKSASLYVTAPILGFGAAAIKTAGDMQALELAFKAVYNGSDTLANSLQKTTDLAKLPGIGLKEALSMSVALQSAGISAEQATSSIREFGNAVALSGGGKVQLASIGVQLAQLSSASKLTGADLKPIIGAAPAAAQALKELYGTVSAGEIQAKLAADGKSTQDFVAEFTAQLTKLPRAAAGINNTLSNVGDTITQFLSRIGTSINTNFNVEGILNKFGNALDALGNKFEALSPASQKLIIGFGLAAAAVGPLLVAIGTIGVAIPAVTAGFAALGITSLAALAPILPIAAAVAAAAYLIYDNWSAIVAYFDGEGGQLLSAAFTAVEGAVSAVVNAFGKLFSLIDGGDSFGGLISASGIIKALFKDIAVGITAIGDTVAGTINFIVNLLSGNFYQALQNIGDVLAGLTLPIRSLLGLVNDAKWENTTMSSFFDSAAKNAASAATAIEAAAKKAQAVLTPLQRYMSQFAASMDAEDYAAMFDTLDELKDKRDELVKVKGASILGSADYTYADAEIKRLNDLIKKYEDTSKAGKKATDEIAKAFTEIRNKVAAVDTRIKIGVELNYDGLQEKIKILQDGIKNLTDKDVTGSNPGLQSLVRQLTGVQAQVEAVKAKMRELLSGKASIGDGGDIYTIDVAKIQEKLTAANLTAELQFSYDKDLVKLKEAIAEASNTAKSELIAAGVPAATPGAATISDSAKETKAAALDATSLQDYLQAMKDISAEQKVFGASFNASAAAISATADRLKDLIALGKTGTPEFAALTEQMKTLKQAADWSDLQQSATTALSSMITDLGAIVGEQLGNMISGVSSGQDALEAVFSGVLSTFGGFLIDLGKMLIQYGLLQLLSVALASNPLTAPAAIAVGIAAIAIGSAFKSAASKGPSGKGGAGSYAPSTSSGSSPRSTASTGRTELVVKFEPVELRADGAALRSVMNVDSYRLAQTR